ncbi:MAG: hypothetical protein HY747_01495 [Elusimicrobia bacterium]|nr:hypothetical protein [Elusimicrobiota bacterium]
MPLVSLFIAQAQAATIIHTTQADFSSGTYAGWGADVGNADDLRLGFGAAEVLPGFSTTTFLPATRRQHAMAAWNGKLYVSGGLDSSDNPQSNVWYATVNLDGTLGSWTVSPNSLPVAIWGHAMVAWGGRLYVTGGYTSGAESSVWYAPINLDGSVGAWNVSANSMPAGRAAHGMTAWDGRLYVAGVECRAI